MTDAEEKTMLTERIAESLDGLELDELRSIVRMVRAIEQRRGILPTLDRRRDRARRSAINAGLRELRDSQTWSRPQPFDGGDES